MNPNPRKESKVSAVRRFNRFYTREIGVLKDNFLGTPYSLTEGRVLYELAHRNPADKTKATASAVCAALDLDPGYLSRIVRQFRNSRLIRTDRSPSDGRETLLSLTPRGRQAIAQLNSRSNKEVAARLSPISESEKSRLVTAMHTIEQLLAPQNNTQKEACILRPTQVGDMGWIAHRQGLLYAQEYNWDEHYEALVAKIVGQFVENFDPRKERCWIAERHNEIVGSVFIVKHTPTIAKLRLLYVEPSARGLGIGQRLVSECIRFARQANYKKLTLWTQSNLYAARRIYKSQGFRLTAKKRHHSFGHNLIAETWDLKL